jgi:hypothetical protein
VHPFPDLLNQLQDIRRSRPAGIDDEIGVFLRNERTPDPHPFAPALIDEPTGMLSFRILENAAGAGLVERLCLLPPHLISIDPVPNLILKTGGELKGGVEDDPTVTMDLDVSPIGLPIHSHDMIIPIHHRHAGQHIMDPAASRLGIDIQASAHRSRNTGRKFKSAQAESGAVIKQVRQVNGGPSPHLFPSLFQGSKSMTKANDNPAEAVIVDQEIRTVSDEKEGA